MKKILLSILLVLINLSLQAQSIQLHDKSGKYCLKIIDTHWIETIDSEQRIAYLLEEVGTEKMFKVYSSGGEEVGFFQDGILFTNDRKILATTKGAWEDKLSQVNYKGIKTILLELDFFEWENWKEVFYPNVE